MRKYISIRHVDYWWGLYGMWDELNCVEFSIFNDNHKKDFFFHFDLVNLKAIQYSIDAEEYEHSDVLEINNRLAVLKQENKEYEILFQYYNDKVEDNRLKINIKDDRGSDPYYLVIVVNTEKQMTLWRIESTLKHIVQDVFDLMVDFDFIDKMTYDETKLEYLNHITHTK